MFLFKMIVMQLLAHQEFLVLGDPQKEEEISLALEYREAQKGTEFHL